MLYSATSVLRLVQSPLHSDTYRCYLMNKNDLRVRFSPKYLYNTSKWRRSSLFYMSQNTQVFFRLIGTDIGVGLKKQDNILV